MKLITDKPSGLKDFNFICMGIVADFMKDYACLLQLKPFNLYIEEIHWGRGKNIETATLHQVDNDKEWAALMNFVTSSTTIFSPKKISKIRKNPDTYFYRTEYMETDDFQKRKKKGL